MIINIVRMTERRDDAYIHQRQAQGRYSLQWFSVARACPPGRIMMIGTLLVKPSLLQRPPVYNQMIPVYCVLQGQHFRCLDNPTRISQRVIRSVSIRQIFLHRVHKPRNCDVIAVDTCSIFVSNFLNRRWWRKSLYIIHWMKRIHREEGNGIEICLEHSGLIKAWILGCHSFHSFPFPPLPTFPLPLSSSSSPTPTGEESSGETTQVHHLWKGNATSPQLHLAVNSKRGHVCCPTSHCCLELASPADAPPAMYLVKWPQASLRCKDCF